LNILVLGGWYGSTNLGDDAILLGIKKLFSVLLPDAKITALSIDPQYTRSTCQIESIKLQSPREILKDPRKLNWVSGYNPIIISGGTPFYDFDHLNRLFTIGLPICNRKKIYCLGIGVKKIVSTEGKFLTRVLMSGVNRISVRDNLSKHLLEKILCKNTTLTGDLALILNPPENKSIRKTLEKSNLAEKKPFIVIAPRIFSNNNIHFYHDLVSLAFINELRHALSETADKVIDSGVKIVFLPMQSSINNDHIEIMEITSRMKNKNFTILEPRNVNEVIAVLSSSSLVIGLRLHSLILGALCSVPIISVPYDDKIWGFMEMINNLGNLVKPNQIKIKTFEILENKISNDPIIKDSILRIKKNIFSEGKKIVESMKYN